MENKSREGVALRFAENLVAGMLQRSGTDFCRVPNACDFMIQKGDNTYALEVKYLDKAAMARSAWHDWRNSGADKHLVLVTGNGDNVFADPTVAPMLLTDYRTKLSVLD
jgi:hypothetical protein